MIATFIPSLANLPAKAGPDWPVPIMIASNFSAVVPLFPSSQCPGRSVGDRSPGPGRVRFVPPLISPSISSDTPE